MKLLFLSFLVVFLTGCSASKTYKVKEPFTIAEFNNGSLKAQSMYDEIIDDFGYVELQPGVTYEESVNILNTKPHLVIENSKDEIRFKFIAKNGNPVDYITVLQFSNNILIRRYLDFSHLN